MKMAKRNSILSQWIFTEYESVNESLPIYRVIYVLFSFIVLLPRSLWISNYPDTFFLPRIGITLFFSGFPDIYFFYILNFLLIVSLLALLVGYKTFYSSIAVGLLFLIGASWEYSFGKVNHDIPLIIIPLIFAASIWGDSVSKGKVNTENRRTWYIPLFALLMGLAMLTAAIPKIISGWLDPSVSALAGHLVRNYFVADRETVLATYVLTQNHFYLLKFLDYGTILIETAFIFSVILLRYFRLVCALACFFHFGVQLMMGIPFTTNLLAYGVFVSWAYIYRFDGVNNFLIKLDELFKNVGFLKLFIASIPLWALYIFIGNPFSFEIGLSSVLGSNIIDSGIMILAVVLATRYIYRFIMDSFLGSHSDTAGVSGRRNLKYPMGSVESEIQH